MNCFIITRKPRSYNKWKLSERKGQEYLQDISSAFSDSYPEHVKLTGDLYGIVYYFYRDVRVGNQQDADNISKPVWDCLKDILFVDDKQVRLRIAGVIDLDKENVMEIKVPPSIFERFLIAVDAHSHFILVECGKLRSDMHPINLEANEN